MSLFGQPNVTINELVNPGGFHFRSFNVKNSSCVAHDHQWQVRQLCEKHHHQPHSYHFREETRGMMVTLGGSAVVQCVVRLWAGSGHVTVVIPMKMLSGLA